MPNPFIRLNAPVTSKEPQDRPEPIPPTPEQYAGENNPYRGIQDHGVPATNIPNPPGTMADTKAGVNYLPPERVMDPVPVEIVNQFGKEFRRHRVHRASVNNERGLQFIGRNDARTSILIRNVDAANSVWLYHAPIDPVNGPNVGFELAFGQDITYYSQDEIYAVGDQATFVTLVAIEHYSVQE